MEYVRYALNLRKNKKSDNHARRLVALGIFITLLMTVILFKAFSYQVWHTEPWKDMAQQQYQQWVRLIAKRGIVYDRHMNILAMDYPVLSIAADPTRIQSRDSVAAVLSRILPGKKQVYLDALRSNSENAFVWLEKDITEEQRRQIMAMEIRGLIPVQGRKRVHPFGDLARQVVGITNVKHEGVGGIEQEMDDMLRGVHGWAIYQKDATNQNHSSLDYPVEMPQDGCHVVLTLDHACQTILEEEVKLGVDRYNAKGGFAVLMDPFTGEILAMGSVVGQRQIDDLSTYEAHLLNQAVQVAYEPGSTFKIVTTAAALEEKRFRTNSLIHCENGAYQIMGRIIHDHDKKYGLLSLNQILENSSNIGIAKVGSKLGKKILYKYIQNFGFGTRSGVQLPGDVSGILRPIFEWNDFSLAAISFGQELSVTGVQMVSMVSAVANGGELLKPWIVRSVYDDNGREIKNYSKTFIRKVISDETADELKTMLFNVVEHGTGNEASVEGMHVAGKTGTAQKSVPGYKGYFPGAYMSSFVGFWPVETPVYALIVVFDEPRKAYWGSTSAAPVFSSIVERIIGLPKSKTPKAPWLIKSGREKKFILTQLETGVANFITNPNPAHTLESPYHLPDMRGLSLREALEKLAQRGIEARIEGSGEVVGQKPEPGCKVSGQMVCTLFCHDYQ